MDPSKANAPKSTASTAAGSKSSSSASSQSASAKSTASKSATANPKVAATVEEIKVKGNQLLDRVREAIEEGNARRILIKKDDRVLMEFPLSVGVGGAGAALLFTPHLAAIGTIVALVSDVHLVIEREPDPAKHTSDKDLIITEQSSSSDPR